MVQIMVPEKEHDAVIMRSDRDKAQVIPVGYRFEPTDEELVAYYLMNKVFYRPLPARQAIQEIDATQFYGSHPKNLVTFSLGEREWFFFIHEHADDEDKEDEDDEDCKGSKRISTSNHIRPVGNGLGFWKPNGSENPICVEDRNAFASKLSLTYFSGSILSTPKKTHWKMVEYRLRFDSNPEENHRVHKKEWVLCRIKRGTDYNGF